MPNTPQAMPNSEYHRYTLKAGRNQVTRNLKQRMQSHEKSGARLSDNRCEGSVNQSAALDSMPGTKVKRVRP